MFGALHWFLALVPVLLMAALFMWLDIFKLMSVKEMLILLLAGGIAALVAWPISGQMLDALPMGFSFYSRVVAPWIEEALKALAIVYLVARNRIGLKLDAVISGFTIGAGFSVIENIFYLVRFPDLAASVWLVRGLGTAVMHGTTTAILAAVAHELGERSTRRIGGRFMVNPLWFAPGYAVAGLIHLTFNQFPSQPMLVMLVTLALAPFALLMLLKFGEGEAHEWLTEESAAHELALQRWRKGEFPDDPGGRQVAALVERAGPDAVDAIYRYCALKTELVLTAERELLEPNRAIAPDDRVRLRAQFAELDILRARLGRAGYAALRPHLPFSRNDEWELTELKELIGLGKN
jgi:RsiW-degrading membrane proteinase PrsW (M82 family)